MKDDRINQIKKELSERYENGFAEYLGNRIARLIRKSNNATGVVCGWAVLDSSTPPKWFVAHPYQQLYDKVIRKSDNKDFYIFVTMGD